MKKQTSYIKKQLVVQILWVTYFILDILKFKSPMPLQIANILILCLGIFAIIYCFLKNGVNYQSEYVLFLVFYMASSFFSFFYNGNADIQEILWPLGFMGIGLLLLNFPVSVSTARLLYYGYCAYMTLLIMFCGGADYLGGRSSRNTVSEMVIIYFCIYMIASYEHRKSMGMFPVIVGLLTCCMAIGRSGILITGIAVLCFVIFKFRKGISGFAGWIRILAMAFLLAILLFLIFFSFSDIIGEVILNFRRRGLKSVRTDIWLDYTRQVVSSLGNVFWGAKITGTDLLNQYSNNLHNSFFMLHAKYGLACFIGIIILIVRMVVHCIRIKNYYLLIPMMLLLMRTNFDYVNFNASGDIVMVYYLLYPFYEQRMKQRLKCHEQ